MKCILDAWGAHHPELIRFVASRVSDPDEANDVVQEVFIRAIRLENGLCGVDNRRAWLFHVARNLLIDRYRVAIKNFLVSEKHHRVMSLRFGGGNAILCAREYSSTRSGVYLCNWPQNILLSTVQRHQSALQSYQRVLVEA